MIVTESQKHIVGGGVVKGLVKIITDAQNVLAEYIEPDSGISDTECINRLLGVLDHQDNVRFVRSALVAPEGAEEVEAIAEYLRERDEAIGNESEYATDEERRATAEAIVALRSRPIDTDKPGVREAALEEAAKVAETITQDGDYDLEPEATVAASVAGKQIAATIRALRTPPASPTEAGEATTSLPDPALTDAIEWLETNQRQLDQDGIEVAVSRQALEQVLAALKDRSHV